MPSAFFGRYRLMAIDGTLFHLPATAANATAFGRSSNQYGPGAYPQVTCVLLAECGSHVVVGLEMDRYDVSEVHGAYRLLWQIGWCWWTQGSSRAPLSSRCERVGRMSWGP